MKQLVGQGAEHGDSSGSDGWTSLRPHLLRICLRFTRGDIVEAEDLLGETCLRLLEARARGVEPENELAFSVAIVANLARDRRRAARHRRSADWPSEATGELASGEPPPDRRASAREALRLTLQMLETVPRRQRQALLLRSLGDDYSLIAVDVGTTEPNARKLVQFARAAVQGRAG